MFDEPVKVRVLLNPCALNNSGSAVIVPDVQIVPKPQLTPPRLVLVALGKKYVLLMTPAVHATPDPQITPPSTELVACGNV